MISRRNFMKDSSLTALAFAGLQDVCKASASADLVDPGFGPLVPDPNKVIDLPEGFTYKVIAKVGQKMDDGYTHPDKADGMATFPQPDGTMILIMNHELNHQHPTANLNELRTMPEEKVYDFGGGQTPSAGGTTTLVYDTKTQKVLKRYYSLAGTDRNCAGGPTPWGSWVTCEESVAKKGRLKKKSGEFVNEKDHGYNFEVPATAEIGLVDPVPLKAMGRFKHEAIAVDPKTGIVYQTEDEHEGLLYRFIPDVKEKLNAGKLQALRVVDQSSVDTRNWKSTTFKVGDKVKVDWIDVEPEPVNGKALRFAGFGAGAAKFARGEGMWYDGEGAIYFACTNGGHKQLGQIWRLLPGTNELELFAEPNDSSIVVNADNLTVAPFGDLIVCEDRKGDVVRLVGVTPEGKFYTFANNHKRTELCGAVFSPDGSTLFVNLQHIGTTLAITGSWDKKA